MPSSSRASCRASAQCAGPTATWAALILALTTAAPGGLHAQSDTTHCTTRRTDHIADWSGQRIVAIDIRSLPPHRLLGAIPPVLHVTTRESRVRERLLFSAGDTVDTLRVAESLRQLRTSRAFLGASLVARCDAAGRLTLRIATRDAWSLRPRVDVRSGGRVTALIEETNLFGTGRLVRLHARSEQGTLGLGVAVADPTLFGGRATGMVSHDVLRRGTISALAVQSRDAGALSVRNSGITLMATELVDGGRASGVPAAASDTVRRVIATALVQQRIRWRNNASLYLQFGAETERTRVRSSSLFRGFGPADVRRAFAGIDLGVARRSAHFITAPWLLPRVDTFGIGETSSADIPSGTELDVVAAVGQDLLSRRPAVHVDAWAGRLFAVGGDDMSRALHGPRALLSIDSWVSGYRTAGSRDWSAGDARFALAATAPSWRGRWAARVALEHLADPDPDVRTLSFAEPLGAMAWRGARIAESAITLSYDQSVQLHRPVRGYAIEGVGFAALTTRWEVTPARADPLTTTTARVQQATLGVGLRFAPIRYGVPSVTLGLGFPFARAAGARTAPIFSVSFSPPFGRGRQRAHRAPYLP